MNETKATFTPGPWYIWKHKAGYEPIDLIEESEHDIYAGEPAECTPGYISGHKRQVCSIDADQYAWDDSQDEESLRATALADAFLIASAPALYAALKEARELIRIFHGNAGWREYQCSPEIKRIDSALRRAEGGGE